jgi:trehalose-6-phosphate synthase
VWGQAEALHEALSMDEAERRRRREAISAHVRENDVRAWLDGLLGDLDGV